MTEQVARMVTCLSLLALIASTAVAGCADRSQTQETSRVNVMQAMSEVRPAEERVMSPSKSEQPFSRVCADGDTGFRSWHNNFRTHGYHGGILKCSDRVQTELAIWTGQMVLFGFASQDCPDISFDAVAGGREMPDIRESREHVTSDVHHARMFLESELAMFRSECGLPELDVDGALEGLDSELETEIVRSWVQNRYGELREGGPTNDELLNQARRDYEELR